MLIQKSIKGREVYIDESTESQSIKDILIKRLEGEDLTESSLEKLLDPSLMKDMEKAVRRIGEAKEKGERVMVFGDYDVDGVTSTSLMMHILRKLEIPASYRIPHRINDGYGLKSYFIDEMLELGVDLCITVDCGSRDAEIVRYAREKGLDIIVTDHHHVPDEMPDDAIAFLNPHRPDCQYPFKHLSGAGVALKLIQALVHKYFSKSEAEEYLRESIDIAAIGTVADCMQLIGENRTIVIEGLKQIKYSRSRGIRRMIEEKIHEDLDADIFGFLIGPRLNAAGRLDSPYKAVNVILNNGKTLEDTLTEIERLNTERKDKTKDSYEQALREIDSSNNIIIYQADNIHHGIIGIVAGRLCEEFYKPVIVLAKEEGKYVASCRSPSYVSIVEILEEYKDMFLAFGGHAGAAGFSIGISEFEVFSKNIIENVNKRDFTSYNPKLETTKVLNLDEIGFKLIESMQVFKPFGNGNPKPLFYIKDFLPESFGFLGTKTRDHLQFKHRYGFKIFAFGMGEYYEILKEHISLGKTFSLVVDISEDNYMGKRGILVKVVDIVV
ncbi:single-stranded-DNA-specific exonuclease RecJ [Candidatus Gracilibacteria bacterium]|nr:single-stranded-DNA-specific exonuclease RecJ [Candidatus Gracilibacteria bacterium]